MHRDDDPLAGPALARLERELLPALLPQQRWFADKHVAFGGVRLIDAAEVDAEPGVHTYLAAFGLESGDRTYHVPVRFDGGSGACADALTSDAFVRALIADVRAGRSRPGRAGGRFDAHAVDATALALPPDAAVRRMNVEQSNTSVVIGERVMLKIYRRTHAGPQPELETARFFSAVRYRNTPPLLGWLEYRRGTDDTMPLAILQAFVPNEGDAWSAAQRSLDAALAGGEGGPSFEERARTLGVRTAEMHRAFATPAGDAAFTPEPVRADDLATWEAQAMETAQRALRDLGDAAARIPAALRPAARDVLARRDELAARLRIPANASGSQRTRFHGDFHLGQVLVTGADVMLVDFEGEPGRDVQARRRKSSPLRDVAGMLRSFDYAAAAGAARGTGPRAAMAARAWERRARAAFLDAYALTIAGCPAVPADAGVARDLIEVFVLEKAFYEVSYELANRPAWLGIPLMGIQRMLSEVEEERHAGAG